MRPATSLDARITRFACDLWIAGVPLGDACKAAEKVMAPQLPGYHERRGYGGLHQPCGDDEGIYDDDSSEWKNA